MTNIDILENLVDVSYLVKREFSTLYRRYFSSPVYLPNRLPRADYLFQTLRA